MLGADERLAIGELLARYGHAIDDRDFAALGALFTDDARYDMSDFDMDVVIGPVAIVDLLTGPTARHPLAHHATNIVIDEVDGEVRVRSKGIGVGNGGRVGSVTYDDVVVRTEDGWQFSSRIGRLRRPD